MGHGGDDDPAGLAPGPQLGAIGLRRWFLVPEAHAEVDEGDAQEHRAFASDVAVVAVTGGLIEPRGEAGGAVELAVAGPTSGVADGGAVVANTSRSPSRGAEQHPERRLGQQRSDLEVGE